MENNPENQKTPTNINSVQVEDNSAGPVVGTIIILLVILLGGVYFWMERSTENEMGNGGEIQEELNQINDQEDSDSLDSIEADLDNTDIDRIDAELNAQ